MKKEIIIVGYGNPTKEGVHEQFKKIYKKLRISKKYLYLCRTFY